MIDTERLHLRPHRLDDLDHLYRLTAPDEMRTYLGPNPPSRAESFDRLLRVAGGFALFGYSTMAVIERGSGDYVGNCGLFRVDRELGPDFDGFPEAGWVIARSRWGQGYAGEAMAAALAWFARERGGGRTVCMITRGNAASERLAERLGYRRFREAEFKGDEVGLYERV